MEVVHRLALLNPVAVLVVVPGVVPGVVPADRPQDRPHPLQAMVYLALDTSPY